jgi:hypothetical protein
MAGAAAAGGGGRDSGSSSGGGGDGGQQAQQPVGRHARYKATHDSIQTPLLMLQAARPLIPPLLMSLLLYWHGQQAQYAS